MILLLNICDELEMCITLYIFLSLETIYVHKLIADILYFLSSSQQIEPGEDQDA